MKIQRLIKGAKANIDNALAYAVDTDDYKQVIKYTSIADVFIDLLLIEYEYDFIDECPEYAEQYHYLTNLVSKLKVTL